MWIAIAVTIILTVLSVGGRSVAKSRERRRQAAAPGASVERPLLVATFKDVNAHVELAACPCGGELRLLGEGPRRSGARELHAVRFECRLCETERTIYFDVARPA